MSFATKFLASLNLKDLLQKGTYENDYSTYGSLWGKVLAARAKKKSKKKSNGSRVLAKRQRSSTRVLMKRRARLEGCRRRRRSGMEKRVSTLKRLIPKSESAGLEGLFTETADYILSLEMRVRVMKIMVDALTASNHDEY